MVGKFFTARVGKGRDRQLTTLAFRNIFDETLARRREAPKDHPEKQDGIRVFRMQASNRARATHAGVAGWGGPGSRFGACVVALPPELPARLLPALLLILK